MEEKRKVPLLPHPSTVLQEPFDLGKHVPSFSPKKGNQVESAEETDQSKHRILLVTASEACTKPREQGDGHCVCEDSTKTVGEEMDGERPMLLL